MSWLEVLAVPPREGLPPVGARIAFEGRTVLGRTYTGKVELDGSREPMGSAAMSQRVRDLASTNITFVNGVSAFEGQPVLQHGDIYEIGHGLVFRYHAHDARPQRQPRLEAAIGDALYDHARWKVYIDWLLERGDPLGRRMALGPDGGDDDARWLGPMARPWRAGNLEVTWRYGYVHTAMLRTLKWENSPDTYWCLRRLFEQEISRFLEVLHVDLVTTHVPGERPPFEKRARMVLEQLQHAPRTLRRVSLGPVMALGWPADLDRELHSLRESRPPFETDRASLVKLFSRIVLRGLDGASDIEVTAEERVHRFGVESMRVGFGVHGIAWLERTGDDRLVSPFLINGRPLRQARLMHGDVIEPAPGVRFLVEVL